MAPKIPEGKARVLFLENKLEPLVPFPGTQKPWKSKCLITGKVVSPTYGKVRDFGHRCIYCSRNVVDPVEAVKLMKKSGFKTLIAFPGSNIPWKSQCLTCKKVTSPTYWNVAKGVGCKFCGGRAVDPKDAIKLMKERGFKTLEPYPGATKLWLVRCIDCKKEFKTRFGSSQTNNGCKYCSGRALDLKDVEIVLTKLKLKPEEEFPGAGTPWKLRCLRCNRVVTPTYDHLTRKDRNVGGCSYCSKRRIHMDDMLELLKKNKLRPIGQFVNGKTPWICQCLKCKREIFPRMNDLRSGQSGCIYCAGLRVDEIDAIKLANKNGFTPLVPYPGANKGWECICNVCEKVSKPRYTSMQQGMNRCKYCSTGGFDFNKPAIVYLITHPKYGAHKIGVAGAAKHNERLKKHKSQGWIIYRHKEFKKGIHAFAVEGKVLHWLRYKKELSPYLSIEQMPQAGWSETVNSSEIDLPTIWAKVEQLSKLER
jgi:DNA-directed RNA polymerase subunit RPC12/RpoP